jgi:hypothetical protein
VGRFFEGLHEVARDHARDEFCQSLRALGFPAELAPRGAAEERVLGGQSLGLVTIPPPYGLIRWANVRKEMSGDDDDYYTDDAVPDPRLHHPDTARLDIKCTTTGGFWPFRDPTGVEWRGNDLDLGILRRLNGDSSLVEPLLGRIFPRRPLRIGAPKQGGLWTITVPGGDTTVFLLGILRPKIDFPLIEQWRCYQAIARHLLDTPLPP